MTTSSTRKVSRFQYAATLLGTLAVFALAPATANATDNQAGGADVGGCTHAGPDGFSIPMDNGQDIFVDGKIVSCRSGKTTTTTAPKRGVSNVRPPALENAAAK